MQILHPTDFSRTAEKAFRIAADLASRSGGGLHVVHVQERYETGSRYGPTLDGLNPELLARIEEERQGEVRRIRERLAHLAGGVGGTHELRWGHPVPELLEASAAFDLVCMGAHGANRFDDLFLGGIAGRFVRRARVPVLTVRAEAEGRPLRRLLVATDLGAASRHAWDRLVPWTRIGVELVLAHVVEDARRRGAPGHAADVAAAMSELAEGRAARHAVREGDPVRVLPRLAEEFGADAIAVGVRHHRGAVGLLLGSRADALLRSSPVPILSVPYVADGG